MQSKANEAAAWCAAVERARSRNGRLMLLGAGLLWIVCSPAWSADDYLSELESEAAKVEAREIDPAEGEDKAVAPPAQRADVSVAPARSIDRGAFEELLKKHYLGTYRFYQKLPERSREEIFEEYRNGTEIGVIRNKIVTRLLQE